MKKKLLLAILTVAVMGSSLTAYAQPKTMPDGTVFDAEFYAEKYPDVKAVFGNDEAALYNHYVQYGKAEGRQATATAVAGKNSKGTTVQVASMSQEEVSARVQNALNDLKAYMYEGLSPEALYYNSLIEKSSGKQQAYRQTLTPAQLDEFNDMDGGALWSSLDSGYYTYLMQKEWFAKLSEEEQKARIIKIQARCWDLIPSESQTEEEWRALFEAGVAANLKSADIQSMYCKTTPLDYNAVYKSVEAKLINLRGTDWKKW